jgi:flagellar hook-associated protein 3 FlgL
LTDKVESLIGFLNTKHGDRYIFAGTNIDERPVSISNVSELLALPSVADAFTNNDSKLQIKVDDERIMEYGMLANDIAEPLFNALRRILEYDSGTLPPGSGAFAPAGTFSDPMTQEQQSFLIEEYQNALAAITPVRDQESKNGVNMQSLDTLITRQIEDRDFIQAFVADMTQVDMAEAITNLQADQTQLQAAIQVVGRLNQISLLNVL